MDRETYSGREFKGDLGEYNPEMPERDFGHVREMERALAENTERMAKALDALAHAIEPTLNPGNVEADPDGSVPSPIRCKLADDLARTNDHLFRLVSQVQRLHDRVDV
jgi:hypothetical protein